MGFSESIGVLFTAITVVVGIVIISACLTGIVYVFDKRKGR